MLFEKFIEDNDFNDEKNKFLIIIGAGFNREFIKDEKKEIIEASRIFKDWKCLLETTKTHYEIKFKNSGNYLIDFENIIINYKNCFPLKAAFEIERHITKYISKLYKEKSLIIDKDNLNLDLLNIFNEKYVSEIINLNFDTLLDEWLANSLNVKFKKSEISNYQDKKSNIFRDNRFKYRNIGKIKIWHIHGDIYSPNSLILSTRKYGMQISKIEKLRCKYKSNKNEYKLKSDFTWFDTIINRPILILGASMSSYEQDVLFAISSRKRNYLKNHNKDSNIFIMSETNNNLGEWAKPIYENKKYNEQWKLLSNLFKN